MDERGYLTHEFGDSVLIEAQEKHKPRMNADNADQKEPQISTDSHGSDRRNSGGVDCL